MKVNNWKRIGLLSIVIFMLSTAAVAHAASVTTTIPTLVTPVGVLYYPDRGEIFVTNYDSGSIQVISDTTNAQIAVIANLPGAPYNMAFDSAKGEIWVAGATTAFAISDSTNQVVTTVTTNAPSSWGTLTDVAYDAKTGKIFVSYSDFTGFNSPYIQVISDNTNAVIANITQSVTGIVDDSAKSEIFASQYLDSSGLSTGNVYVISAQTNAITATIPVNGAPGKLAYDSGKGEIFVALGNSIIVISDSTNKVVATISNLTPGTMAYNPNKGEIYSNTGTSLTIISDKTNSVVETVNINGQVSSSPGVAYDSGTSMVYAINNPGSITGSMGSLAVISDSSSGSSPTPAASTSTSASPNASPTVPEFDSTALAIIAIAFAAVALSAVAIVRKKTTRKYA